MQVKLKIASSLKQVVDRTRRQFDDKVFLAFRSEKQMHITVEIKIPWI